MYFHWSLARGAIFSILVSTTAPLLASETAPLQSSEAAPFQASEPTTANQADRPDHGPPVSPAEFAALSGKSIESLSIQNQIGRTRDSFVRKKIGLTEGMPFDAQTLKEGLARLRDTRIFKDVTASAFDRGGKVHLEVILNEKWTTLPDVRFGGGGGTSYFRVGVFDINWFGLGGQGLIAYENRNGTNNGDAWLRYPNAFGTNNLLGAGLTRTTTLLTEYGSDRRILGGQAMSKTTILLDSERSVFSDRLILGYRMEPEWVGFNDYQISSNVQRENEAKGRKPSPETKRILHRIQLWLNFLEYKGVMTDGWELVSHLVPAFEGFGSDYDVFMSRSYIRFFSILPYETNLATRVVLATSSSSKPENLNRLGGLTEVRGYYDGEFAGRFALYGNAELRKALFSTWSFVWQTAVFYDCGVVGRSMADLGQQTLRDGVGFGLRLAPDFVHLATLRLDYAIGMSDSRNSGGISFGLLNFF
jgi:outer membrane protein assembly factor BamA